MTRSRAAVASAPRTGRRPCRRSRRGSRPVRTAVAGSPVQLHRRGRVARRQRGGRDAVDVEQDRQVDVPERRDRPVARGGQRQPVGVGGDRDQPGRARGERGRERLAHRHHDVALDARQHPRPPPPGGVDDRTGRATIVASPRRMPISDRRGHPRRVPARRAASTTAPGSRCAARQQQAGPLAGRRPALKRRRPARPARARRPGRAARRRAAAAAGRSAAGGPPRPRPPRWCRRCRRRRRRRCSSAQIALLVGPRVGPVTEAGGAPRPLRAWPPGRPVPRPGRSRDRRRRAAASPAAPRAREAGARSIEARERADVADGQRAVRCPPRPPPAVHGTTTSESA